MAKPSILLVDDEPDIVTELKRCLVRNNKFNVTTASNLKDALIEAKNSSFDAVITDKNMGRHRGVTPLLDYMQTERPFTPVVLISGEPSEFAEKELYCHYFIYKPNLDMRTLPKEITNVIESTA